MFIIIKYADNKALMDVIFDSKYNTALSNNKSEKKFNSFCFFI